MAQARQCGKCGGSMGEGFVLDRSHGAMTLATWVEGAAEKSVWTGVRTAGRRQSDIATWRCTRCGFLESYAAAEPDLSAHAGTRKVALTIVLTALAVALLIGVVGAYLAQRG